MLNKVKSSIKKFIEKCKNFKLKDLKNNPTLITVIILVLILVCAIDLLIQMKNADRKTEETHEFFSYFFDYRTNFEGKIVLNRDDLILSLDSKSVSITSNPVYFSKNIAQMILPANMEIVFPYRNNPMYKLGAFSKIYLQDNKLYVNSEAGKGELSNCFLYDGDDLYVFVEETQVSIGDTSYKLGPMSFIEVTKNYIRIYDKENDEYEMLEEFEGKVIATVGKYYINLMEDNFTFNIAEDVSNYFLLIRNVDMLNLYQFEKR